MSDIKQRIAEIMKNRHCHLTGAFQNHDEWADHVADVLVSELGFTRENIRRIVTTHIGNTFGSGDEVADDIYYHLASGE